MFLAKYQNNSPEQAGAPRRGRRPLPAASDRQRGARLGVQRDRGGPTPLPGCLRPSATAPGTACGGRVTNPPPLPPSLKDVVLFLPRTKDNKGSKQGSNSPGRSAAASAIGSLFPASPGRVSRRSLPPTVRDASRPRAPPAPPLPQRSPGRRGPGLPGRLLPRAPAPARAAASLPRSPPGRPGAAPGAAADPWAAAGRLTARVAAASPAILCRVWCLSRLLARLYSLLLLLPPPHPPHTPHNMASSLRRWLRRRQELRGVPARSPPPTSRLQLRDPQCARAPPPARRGHWLGQLPATASRSGLKHSHWCLPPAPTAASCTLLVSSNPTSSTLSATMGRF